MGILTGLGETTNAVRLGKLSSSLMTIKLLSASLVATSSENNTALSTLVPEKL